MATKEIFTGLEKNEGLGSSGVCMPNGVCIFRDTEPAHEPGVIYIQGEWHQENDFAEHVNEKTGYIAIKYDSKESDAVMEATQSVKVEVLLDGKSLAKSQAGKDVIFESTKSIMIVNRKRAYNIASFKDNEEHEIKIISSNPSFRVFSFSFS